MSLLQALPGLTYKTSGLVPRLNTAAVEYESEWLPLGITLIDECSSTGDSLSLDQIQVTEIFGGCFCPPQAPPCLRSWQKKSKHKPFKRFPTIAKRFRNGFKALYAVNNPRDWSPLGTPWAGCSEEVHPSHYWTHILFQNWALSFGTSNKVGRVGADDSLLRGWT